MGMPLVLSPKTLPMDMFQPKCQPSEKPRRPPVKRTLRPPATPPTKMLVILCHLSPPGEFRCMTTKKADSTTSASRKAAVGARPMWAAQASARLKSIQPRTGSSSFTETIAWNTASQKMFAAKPSDLSNTSKSCRKCSQPASSSTAKMKATSETPTQVPVRISAANAPSNTNPSDDIGRMSRKRPQNHTVSTEPKAMPARMQASLQRRLPPT
mmetsp:Transcript_24933/g.55111  ORF Transcript_24933/g.55111 Transcript_24933/m.55111 type:complete len:212 (+) Transcript_24933:194-829(+)